MSFMVSRKDSEYKRKCTFNRVMLSRSMTTFEKGHILENIDTKNCAVRAVRDVTEHDYFYVNSLFEKHGRKFDEPTHIDITLKVLDELGFSYVDVTKRFKSRTIRTFQRESKYYKIPFLVRVNRHILSVHRGVSKDWAADRLHRICQIYAVYKI